MRQKETVTFVPLYEIVEGGHRLQIAAPNVAALSKRIRRYNASRPTVPIRTIPGYACLEDLERVYCPSAAKQ